MLFTEGTRVRFTNTGDVGVITEILGDDMVNVLLDDDDIEIPAFLENLEREDQPSSRQPGNIFSPNKTKPSVKAKFLEGKQEKKRTPPPKTELDPQYFILKSMGIQLAFDPELGKDGSTVKYQIYLLNDTRYDALFSYKLMLKDSVKQKTDGKIDSVSFVHLGELFFDQLNDSPLVEMDCWQVTTIGTGNKLHKFLKIRAKQFFKNIKTAPLLDKPVHLYPLFDNFDKEQEVSGEDLKTYTQRNARKPKNPSSNYRRIDAVRPDEFAAFQNEIDLHIEKLTDTSRKLNNSEILRIQLSQFESYLAKAIELGMNNVFIIHGIGKGKLRNAIATSLMKNPQVKTFKNEFHPKYGWGATEVIL